MNLLQSSIVCWLKGYSFLSAKKKRLENICIKPITSYGAIDETRTHTFIQTLPPQSSASTYSATIAHPPLGD